MIHVIRSMRGDYFGVRVRRPRTTSERSRGQRPRLQWGCEHCEYSSFPLDYGRGSWHLGGLMHVIITGAAGVLGRCATEALEARHRLTLLDIRPDPARGIIGVDLADAQALRAAATAADVVIHLGAIPTEGPCAEIVRNNVLATTHVFELARETGIRRVVFASTIQVYGGVTRESVQRPLTPALDAAPNSHYAASKLHGEHLGAMYARRHTLEFIGLRIGVYMRPGQTPPRTGAPPFMLSVEDATRMFVRSVEAEFSGAVVINGMSRGAEGFYDLEPGRRAIGFDPQDSAEEALRQHLVQLGTAVV